jgi:hypothetical protein
MVPSRRLCLLRAGWGFSRYQHLLILGKAHEAALFCHGACCIESYRLNWKIIDSILPFVVRRHPFVVAWSVVPKTNVAHTVAIGFHCTILWSHRKMLFAWSWMMLDVSDLVDPWYFGGMCHFQLIHLSGAFQVPSLSFVWNRRVIINMVKQSEVFYYKACPLWIANYGMVAFIFCSMKPVHRPLRATFMARSILPDSFFYFT